MSGSYFGKITNITKKVSKIPFQWYKLFPNQRLDAQDMSLEVENCTPLTIQKAIKTEN